MSHWRESLGPLLRLRQIVEELRAAAERNDLEVICAAANLLGPTVERCNELRDSDEIGAGEAAELALQIRHLLADCEAVLTASMRSVSVEIKRIRQGKRAIMAARSRNPAQQTEGLNG